MRRRIIFSLIAVLFVSAFQVNSAAQTRRSTAFAKRTAVKKPATRSGALSSGAVRTRSGLTYLITKAGEGPLAKAGDTVTVHYSGVFTDGRKFDSSRDRNRPIEIPLGQGRVIKGWEEGLTKLRAGGQAIFVVPPSLAYGSEGAGGGLVPPDSTLIFIVELVNIRPQ